METSEEGLEGGVTKPNTRRIYSDKKKDRLVLAYLKKTESSTISVPKFLSQFAVFGTQVPQRTFENWLRLFKAHGTASLKQKKLAGLACFLLNRRVPFKASFPWILINSRKSLYLLFNRV